MLVTFQLIVLSVAFCCVVWICICRYDFNIGFAKGEAPDIHALLSSYATTGFQAVRTLCCSEMRTVPPSPPRSTFDAGYRVGDGDTLCSSLYVLYRDGACALLNPFFLPCLHDHSVYLPTLYYALAEPKSNFGLAVNEINRMRKWRLSDEPVAADDDGAFLDPKVRAETKCKIFFGYTSNLISAGTRESIRFLAQNKMVSACFDLVSWQCRSSSRLYHSPLFWPGERCSNRVTGIPPSHTQQI